MKLSFKYVACATLICLASFTFARVPNPELIERSFRKKGNIVKRNANQASFCIYDFNVYTSDTQNNMIQNSNGCFSSYAINFNAINEVIQIDVTINSAFNCGTDELVINDNMGTQFVACDSGVTVGQIVTFISKIGANWVRIARVNHVDISVDIKIKQANNDNNNNDNENVVNEKEGCGKPYFTPNTNSFHKIVGGDVAVRHSWPWQVGLYYYSQYCAGTLINKQWVLTAAHCDVFGVNDFKVHLGFHNITDTNEITGKIVTPKLIISHPDFNDYTLENDVALIKLTEPVTFTNEIKPICLPGGRKVNVNDQGYVIGWGTVDADGGGDSSPLLRQVKVPVRTNSSCSLKYFDDYKKDSQLCAGVTDVNAEKDSCQGDSGGPYFMYDTDKKSYYQVGIVSYGIKCAGDGVYTRVSYYEDWINDTMAANQ